MAANNWHQERIELAWIDPIDAVELFPEGLLLDGRGDHPEARFAYLGLEFGLTAALVDGQWSLEENGQTSVHDKPLEFLTDLTNRWRKSDAEEHPFTGGFIGYFGYETARIFEPNLPPPKAPRDVPDAILKLCMDAFVFDYKSRKVFVYASGSEATEIAKRLQDYAAKAKEAYETQIIDAPEADWTTTLSEAQFGQAVEQVRKLILNGDLFQANIATKFQANLAARPIDMFRLFAKANPSPYMAFMDFGDWSLVSCSPEQLFVAQNETIHTRPIAGTRARGQTGTDDLALEQELLGDPKEQAEHTMLVDLLRNDIAKVSLPGTTTVTEAMSVERYQHVMHLVSCVEGKLRPETTFVDWLAALFPGGTITGAPKHRACLRIHEAEPVPRGPYTGSAGYLSWGHNAAWNILIRTLIMHPDGRSSVHAGSGIVADSQPDLEWQEAQRKAASLIRAGGAPATRIGEVTRHHSWEPPQPNRQVSARVILVDNYDSFVHNIADYAALAGAQVKVIRNDEDLAAATAEFDPTHIILGPGPGWPSESGCTLEAAKSLSLPTLGICLGHQALAQENGGAVRVQPAVHGKVSSIFHDEKLMQHLPSPFRATRYHSLVVDVPPGWKKTAWLDDGTVMAMRHPTLPVWGLQFHPESFCTEGGLEIIMRFLES